MATDGVWAGPRRTEPQATIVWTRNSPALKAAKIGIAMGQRGLAPVLEELGHTSKRRSDGRHHLSDEPLF
jgi:hypothetical protein